MWPFSSIPEHSASEVNGRSYDYIIVGGGTAGCVLASRLSEGDASVLVIEKGHFKDNIVSRMPLLSQNMFLGDALQVQGNRWSEPIPGANGRRNRLWAVEGIGGASRMNGMLWTRGFPGDYDAWSDMGLEDWSYAKLEPYFRNIENAIVHPHSQSRGHEGPIEIRQYPFPFVWFKYFDKVVQKLGLRHEKDLNDPAAAPAMGYFNLDTAIDARGNRISAFTAYMNKSLIIQRRGRLTICTGATASRLEVDARAGFVRGVHIRSSTGPLEEYYVKARREVIVCSGAACSPQLLLLSGIGPSQASKDFEIPIVKELHAVGATLSDHYSIPIMLEVPKKETFHLLQSIWGVWHILLWLVIGKGLLSLTSMSTTIYVRTGAINKDTMEIRNRDEDGHDNLDASKPENVPDIEIMVMPNSSVERAVDGRTLISLYPTLVQPRGSGRVELVSKDPFTQPRITYPMFTNEHDIACARLAVRFTMRLAEELQYSGYPYPSTLAFAPGQDPTMLEEWEKSAPIDYLPVPMPDASSASQKAQVVVRPKQPRQNKTWRTVTDEEIDDYIRRVSHTSLHFSGTCPMSRNEHSGVVDQQLRVHGFSNLRIADTSVFPKIPSCHTMAPVMVVAERCAEMIKATWEGKKSQ
ncbi:putative GMC oxidoreductase [Xylariaceae sp. FL0804]|nr:putative GMC oxidoreductase [Xylariaceae sp. FL0804]